MKRIIIAIDGFSSCGKSTLAKALAKQLHYSFIDSGAMYRAVTLYFIRNGINFDNEAQITDALNDIHIHFELDSKTKQNLTFLNDENVEVEIRKMEVSSLVSEVAALKAVRKEMVALQRKAGKRKGIVMDGRDIGSNVFPNAELKIFMTADNEVRAHRRFLELQEKGTPETIETIKKNLAHRDHIDSTREENPLTQTNDAIVLDNTNLTMDEQLQLALQWANEKIEALSEA